jgi:hypothetical protein
VEGRVGIWGDFRVTFDGLDFYTGGVGGVSDEEDHVEENVESLEDVVGTGEVYKVADV